MTTDLRLFAEEPSPQRPQGRTTWVIVAALVGAAVVASGVTAVLAKLGRPLTAMPLLVVSGGGESGEPGRLSKRAAQAAAALDRQRPRGVWLTIDTHRNRLLVFKNGELVRSAICSTGTGIVLRDPRNGREWVFDTPLGERAIQHKVRNPVWAKPDWAFIEEGLEPPTDPNERFDSNSLGDYGLYMGDGYIIHGTLFKTLLGRRVTHGCIRLGDEDLEFVYRNAPIGSRVYLY